MSTFQSPVIGKLAKAAIVVSAVASMGIVVPTAYADDVANPAVVAALQRVQDGTWTEADAELIGSVPELAAAMPDPRVEPTVTVEEIEYVVLSDGTMETTATSGLTDADAATAATPEGLESLIATTPGADASVTDLEELPAEEDDSTDSGVSTLAAAGKWKWTHVWVTNYSYLGNVIYKYHQKAHFKYDGSKVTAWGKRYDYPSNEQDVVNVGDRIVNQKSGVPAKTATSFMKRQFQLCLPVYGCYATNYPWSKIKVKGTGATSFTSSNN